MADSMFLKCDYYLDESDPDVMVLHRQDDAFVVAFSARGATTEGIVEATEQDYVALLQENSDSLAVEAEKHQRN